MRSSSKRSFAVYSSIRLRSVEPWACSVSAFPEVQPSELNGQAVLFLSYGNETLEDLMRRDLMATQLRASLAHCTSGNALTLQAQGSTHRLSVELAGLRGFDSLSHRPGPRS
jgi:hypothetical protein